MKSSTTTWVLILSITVPFFVAPLASADVTSPSIKDRGKKYSTEKPLTNYYGSGSSGRLVEASELRMVIEDLLAAGEFEKAIPKAKKAVQLDPGDPAGHLFLAKAMTAKFYSQKGEIDEKLLAECAREWNMIRYHDADPTEQWEAGNEAKKLAKIAKALDKEKLRKKQAQEERDAGELARSDKDASAKESETMASKFAVKIPKKSESTEAVSDENEKTQIADRKKRFGLF